MGLVLLLLVPAVLLTLICIWIVIPPGNAWQIILSVASIELSLYLLLINVILMLLAWSLSRSSRFGKIAAAIAALNVVLCALPLYALWHTPASEVAIEKWAVAPVKTVSIPIRLGTQNARIIGYLPQREQYSPPSRIVVAIYGGAWQRGGPENDAALNRHIAAAGFAVFALDYRHAPAYRFPVALDDVRSEIALVRKNAAKYGADPNDVSVIGHSSGGELAELLAFERGSRIHRLVSYSGAIDLAKGYEFPPVPDPIGVRSVIEEYLGATPQQAPRAYREASPIMHVRTGLPQTLLIYGTRDHVVDIRYARKFRDEIAAHGNNVRLLELPWTEHAFEDVPWGLHFYTAADTAINFLSQ